MISRQWEDFFFKHVPSSRWITLLIVLFREKIHNNFGWIQEKLAWIAMQQYVTEVRITLSQNLEAFLRVGSDYNLEWEDFLSSSFTTRGIFQKIIFAALFGKQTGGNGGWKRRSIRESFRNVQGKGDKGMNQQ